MAQRLAAALSAGAEDLTAFMAALRRQREREMVRIAWRDLAGVGHAGGNAGRNQRLCRRGHRGRRGPRHAASSARTYGKPRSAAGEAQPLIVLGMGKLGGGELNFSSDIDLIFVFPGEGRDRRARAASTTRISSRGSAGW